MSVLYVNEILASWFCCVQYANEKISSLASS